MGLAGLLIVLGIICLIFFNFIIGIVLVIAGIAMLFWAGPSFRSGYGGSRRYYW